MPTITVLFDEKNAQTLVPCSFVMQYYVFRALEEAGLYEKTEKLWLMWQDLLNYDLSTVPEIPGKYTRSDCHAWGSLLLHELPRKMLGVSPLAPGYERVRIKPMGLFLQSMQGEVPVPSGEKVTVSWKVEGNRFLLEGNTPVAAEIVLPDGTRYEAQGNFTYNCPVL